MKDQYVGDVNDYLKYALLRALAGDGAIRVGVCWMLTGSDGRSDGNRRSYLKRPAEWERFDPPLYAKLASLDESLDRRVAAIQESEIIPNAIYFDKLLEDSLCERERYFKEAHSRLDGCDLIFFDPDNGLERSISKGKRNSSKYVYWDEISVFYGTGHSVLVYQHFPRENRKAFTERLRSHCTKLAPNPEVCVFQTAHTMFVLAAHPKHQSKLLRGIGLAGNWPETFVQVHRYSD